MLQGTYIEIYIISILSFLFLTGILLFQKTKRKIKELEEKINTIENARVEEFITIDGRLATLKKMFIDKVNQLDLKINELLQKNNHLYEKYNAIGVELDKKMEPFQSLFEVTVSKVNSSQEALKEAIEEGENEIKKMAEGIYSFSKEIREMKDFIRERTIDLEL